MTLNTFQQWQVDNGHHVTENVDGDEFHAPELCPLCEKRAETKHVPNDITLYRLSGSSRCGIHGDDTTSGRCASCDREAGPRLTHDAPVTRTGARGTETDMSEGNRA